MSIQGYEDWWSERQGTWRVEIRLDDAFLSQVTFEYSNGSSDDNYEENDSRSAAWNPGNYWGETWLSTFNGMGIQNDDDWYRIDFYENGGLYIDCQFSHAEGNIDIQLYDSNGTLLQQSTSNTDNESIYFSGDVPSQDFYIRVYGDNSGNSYDLRYRVLF
jgi:hypothetical protein